MQQIYRKTTVPTCDFHKVAKQWKSMEHLRKSVFVLPPIYHSIEAAKKMSEKKSATKGNSKGAGYMATNLLKTNFFTCIIEKFC